MLPEESVLEEIAVTEATREAPAATFTATGAGQP